MSKVSLLPAVHQTFKHWSSAVRDAGPRAAHPGQMRSRRARCRHTPLPREPQPPAWRRAPRARRSACAATGCSSGSESAAAVGAALVDAAALIHAAAVRAASLAAAEADAGSRHLQVAQKGCCLSVAQTVVARQRRAPASSEPSCHGADSARRIMLRLSNYRLGVLTQSFAEVPWHWPGKRPLW